MEVMDGRNILKSSDLLNNKGQNEMTDFNGFETEPSTPNGTNMVQVLLLAGAVIILLIQRYGNGNSKFLKKHEKSHRNIPVVKSILPIRITIVESLYNLFLAAKYGLGIFERHEKEYGDLYEMPVGFTSAYCTSDPTICQKLLTSTNPSHLNKAKEFREIFLKDFMSDVLFAADYDVWHTNKKILGRSFTHKSLQSYLGIMNRNAKRMGQDMMQASKVTRCLEGERVAELQYNTVKIIAEIILGTDVMTHEELQTFLETYRAGKEILLARVSNPLLMFQPIWRFHPKKRQLDSCVKSMRGALTNVANKYRERRQIEQAQGIQWLDAPEDDEIGIVKPFRSMVEEMIHGGMGDIQILDEVLGMFAAGHESTSATLNLLLFQLALHPEYQKLCGDEVDELLASKALESDQECELTMEDVNNLKFLEMCIWENLRLGPTFPALVRRLEEPLKIDDELELEGNGKNLIMLPWVLHRNPEYYPNPERFDPYRFLPENVKERQAKHPYSYLPFSSGPKMCIGWKFALMEMKIVMLWILRNFEISTTDKFEELRFYIDISLKPHKDINLILKPRRRN